MYNTKEVLRNNGEIYTISPYQLVWNGDFYYVVGFSNKHNKVVFFMLAENSTERIRRINCFCYFPLAHILGSTGPELMLIFQKSLTPYVNNVMGLFF